MFSGFLHPRTPLVSGEGCWYTGIQCAHMRGCGYAQFHPEKSGAAGLAVIEGFLNTEGEEHAPAHSNGELLTACMPEPR